MGLSASQGRMLLLTARKNDLEFRAQQISQRRLVLSSQLEQISTEYEEAMSNRVMSVKLMDASGNTNSSKEYNLTYAALMSGTAFRASTSDATQYGIVASGIAGTKGMLDDKVYATTNYRLVNSDGYIVIADASEIPTAASSTTTKKDYSFSLDTNNNGFTIEGKDQISNNDYVFLSSGKAVKYSDLTDDEKQNSVIKINGKFQTIALKANSSDKEESKDSTTTPTLETETPKGLKMMDVTSSGGSSRKEFSLDGQNTFNVTESDESVAIGLETKSVGENKYALYKNFTDANGVVQTKLVAHYVVDKSLANDSVGNDSGENYLQECLRNGLYSLQKGTEDADDEDNDGDLVEWRDISWDSATSVYDTYYDDDDAAAKAKYDRLQTQIQNQDKKLELELNNIETQRSAVTTETDSVKKVISDNVEKTFKTFA